MKKKTTSKKDIALKNVEILLEKAKKEIQFLRKQMNEMRAYAQEAGKKEAEWKHKFLKLEEKFVKNEVELEHLRKVNVKNGRKRTK